MYVAIFQTGTFNNSKLICIHLESYFDLVAAVCSLLRKQTSTSFPTAILILESVCGTLWNIFARQLTPHNEGKLIATNLYLKSSPKLKCIFVCPAINNLRCTVRTLLAEHLFVLKSALRKTGLIIRQPMTR